MSNTNKKVYVGLSGGVDSSVSAHLLKEAGYDVEGVFIKVWYPEFLECNWKEERRDAMRVCAHLDIPFHELDLSKEYKEEVADYMISEYKKGRTPNPDVMCNRYVKFGGFLKWALLNGADYVATGHYAKNIGDALVAGADEGKDQSYFLWTLTKEQLSHVLFPVGHLQKSEVRAIAEKEGLSTASKKDSQGICFLGDISMKDFLTHYIKEEKGNVLNEEGVVIGEHDGALFFTIGERRGFRITKKTPNDKPYFVVSKDIEQNTITVSDKEGKDNPVFNASSVKLCDMVMRKDNADGGYQARLRYRQTLFPCKLDGNTATFNEPQKAVAVGQSLVLYRDNECVGGGIIEEILP